MPLAAREGFLQRSDPMAPNECPLTVYWQSCFGNTVQNVHTIAITNLLASTVNEMMDVAGRWGSPEVVQSTLA